MSTKSKVTTATELTSTGFIREATKQLRNGFTISMLDVLDPFPDAYKVWMRKVIIKKKGKPQNKMTSEFLVARPMEGHKPTGGYDVLLPDGSTQHFELFTHAKHHVALKVEAWLNEMIDAGGFFE